MTDDASHLPEVGSGIKPDEEPAPRDWKTWHTAYDEPGSPLAQRLAAVQDRVRIALDTAAPGPIRVLSLCAGEGRDLLPVLATHPRRADVTARLVEFDPAIAEIARTSAAAAGLSAVDVVTGDAALTDHYRELAPAQLVLLCGIFGNIPESDIRFTVQHAAMLTARGGTVLWTRHRREPDLTGTIAGWFAEAGFTEIWRSGAGLPTDVGIGAQRQDREPAEFVAGVKLFTFRRKSIV
jgi:hypothetical protein